MCRWSGLDDDKGKVDPSLTQLDCMRMQPSGGGKEERITANLMKVAVTTVNDDDKVKADVYIMFGVDEVTSTNIPNCSHVVSWT